MKKTFLDLFRDSAKFLVKWSMGGGRVPQFMATVLLRHTTHTADRKKPQKGPVWRRTPCPIQADFSNRPACGKDVFSENGLVRHVA